MAYEVSQVRYTGLSLLEKCTSHVYSDLCVFKLDQYAFMNCDYMCFKYYNVVKQCYSPKW
jgi:hypothetical protein